MRHLKDNMSPTSSVDSRSETIRPAKSDVSFEDQGLASSKAKKKKESYLKKQSEAKRKNSDVSDSGDVSSSLNNNDVKLFTRAQAAKFSKLLDAESPVSVENGNYSIQDIINEIHTGSCDTLKTEHIFFVQHELSEGIGFSNLKLVLDIMSLVSDSMDLQVHFEHVLGPKLYGDYRQHIHALWCLEKLGLRQK